MQVPKVISLVVDQDLCVGCGLCVTQCASKALTMDWGSNGFLIPTQTGACTEEGSCIAVCPFNPLPKEEVKTEDELAQIFLAQSAKRHPQVGHFENTYAGYSNRYRETSSSGGMATYLLAQLFQRNIIQAALVVNETDGFYKYQLVQQESDLLHASKTRYYPVTLADVFQKIDQIEGQVAVVGVACFIKAIRLAQHENQALKIKIPFLIGIICGGLKSKFYTQYLASRTGFELNDFERPQYRIKDDASTASDYAFGSYAKRDKAVFKTMKMAEVGDMWGTGFFKNNACDFCEDVMTELADVSLGDAWIRPYTLDGKGTSIIITRTALADRLIQEGLANEELKIDDLPLEQAISSQRGSFNHRHKGLAFRMKQRRKEGKLVPPKRSRNLIPISFEFKLVQLTRMIVRAKTLEVWKRTKLAAAFEAEMAPFLIGLRNRTRLYHYLGLLKAKLGLRK